MWQFWVLFGDWRRRKCWFGAFTDFFSFHVGGGLDADVVAALHLDDDCCALTRAGNQYALVGFSFTCNFEDVSYVAVSLF